MIMQFLGKRAAACLGVTAILLFCAIESASGSFTLTSGNSVVEIEEVGGAGVEGMVEWEVDGVNHLFLQWFWQRVGGAGGEDVLSALTGPTASQPASNILTLGYGPGANGLAVDVTYTLTGGPSGSGSSVISELILLTNTTAAPMDLHFFQYTDFDLGNTPFDDVARLVPALLPNEIEQFDPDTNFAEVITTPAASHYEIAIFPTIINDLTDGAPTTLNDTPGPGVPLGPADVSFAFQWDFTLAPQGVALISKTKHIQGVIPEPASLAIWGLGALSLTAFGLRRRRS
jgi:hypothetical protein